MLALINGHATCQSMYNIHTVENIIARTNRNKVLQKSDMLSQLNCLNGVSTAQMLSIPKIYFPQFYANGNS